MDGKGDKSKNAGNHRVPVEDSRLGTDAPVGPESFEEVAILFERHATNNVAQRCAVEDGQQKAGQRK